jgi:hypothetical protein
MAWTSSRLPTEGRFPSLAGATGWRHSPPLEPAGLREKVVLVDFCTFTCINWLRTLSYVRAWDQSYRDQGLVVIGLHTPEFSFGHDLENIRRALASMAIDYPIAVDNDYAVWDAFANHYWPALYFIDAEGSIRHHWFGEGDYERSEAVIQQLLRDAGVNDVGDELVAIDPVGPEVGADWDNLGSPETYLGTEKARNFASKRVAGGPAGRHRSSGTVFDPRGGEDRNRGAGVPDAASRATRLGPPPPVPPCPTEGWCLCRPEPRGPSA